MRLRRWCSETHVLKKKTPSRWLGMASLSFSLRRSLLGDQLCCNSLIYTRLDKGSSARVWLLYLFKGVNQGNTAIAFITLLKLGLIKLQSVSVQFLTSVALALLSPKLLRLLEEMQIGVQQCQERFFLSYTYYMISFLPSSISGKKKSDSENLAAASLSSRINPFFRDCTSELMLQ